MRWRNPQENFPCTKQTLPPSNNNNNESSRAQASAGDGKERRDEMETEDALGAYNQCLRGTLYGLSSEQAELGCLLNLARLIYVRLRVAVWG